MAAIHAKRAASLIGTRFRAQGRDREQGLDCVGLCLAAYRLPAALARDDYRLRGDHRAELEEAILTSFWPVGPSKAKPGDLLLLLPAPDQLHLGILTDQGFIHADARLRRVVETPGRPPWPIGGTYRLRAKSSR